MKGEEMAVRIICNYDGDCQRFSLSCIHCDDATIIPLEPVKEGKK